MSVEDQNHQAFQGSHASRLVASCLEILAENKGDLDRALFTGVSQEFKGYIFKIKGGCDKQGFPMKQGVLTAGRVAVLMSRGEGC